MYEDIYKKISDSLINAFSPFIESQTAFISNAFNSITDTLQESLCSIAAGYSQNTAAILANEIAALVNAMIPAIELPCISLPDVNFLKEINFQEEYIELTEDDCNAINTLLESPDTNNDASGKVSKGKIAVEDFIKAILIPIFAILLPMMQNSYYNKIVSLESQKEQIREQEYQAQVLQTMSDMVNSLELIQESLERLPAHDSHAEESQHYFDDIQEILDKFQDTVSGCCNTDSTVPDTPTSSGTDIYKE